MREIKFRAWGENKMMYPENMDKNLLIITPVGKVAYIIPPTERSNRELIWTDYELMQYTGLKDKNGVEIYEGDILATENDGKDGADKWGNEIIGAVGWDNQYAQFTNMPSNDDESIYSLRYVKVIGNIWEGL